MENHTRFAFQKLDIYQAALQLAQRVHEARIQDSELRDQATRASKSAFLNVAEGLPHDAPGLRRRHFALAFIEEKAELGVTRLCRSLSVSRSGFYAWLHRPPSTHEAEDTRLKVLVHEAHERGRKYYGSPRIHRALKKQHIRISRKRVVRLMQEEKLVGRVRRRFRCTTDSDHGLPVATNLLDREFNAEKPNQRWVGDTTELIIPNGKLYLAAEVTTEDQEARVSPSEDHACRSMKTLPAPSLVSLQVSRCASCWPRTCTGPPARP